MTNRQKPDLESKAEAELTRDEVSEAISNDVFGPETKCCQDTTGDQLVTLAAENDALRGELEQLSEQPDAPNPYEVAIRYLEENATSYVISRNKQSGKISVNGEFHSDQCGQHETFVIRDYRGKPPYLIHPEDTVKINRKVQFGLVSVDLTLPEAVEQIILTYCPGPVVVETDECKTLYKSNRPFVQIFEGDVEDFRKFQEFGTYCAQLNLPDVETHRN